MDNLVRTRLVEVELASGNLAQDLSSLFIENISVPELKTGFEVADITSIPSGEFIHKIKEKFSLKIQELKDITEENNKLENDSKAAVNNKHTRLHDLKVVLRETDIHKDMASKLSEISKCLQKTIKAIVDDRNRIEDAEKARVELIKAKFNETITDITSKLAVEEEGQNKQSEENTMLREKMEQFKKQSALREEHIASQVKLKLDEIIVIHDKADEIDKLVLADKEKTKALQDVWMQCAASDKELRDQISVYAAKSETCYDSLKKGHEMFKQFEERSQQLVKLIKKLEVENHQLRNSITESEVSISQHEGRETTYQNLLARKSKLEVLCRDLQKEVKDLATELNITAPTPSLEEIEAEMMELKTTHSAVFSNGAAPAAATSYSKTILAQATSSSSSASGNVVKKANLSSVGDDECDSVNSSPSRRNKGFQQ